MARNVVLQEPSFVHLIQIHSLLGTDHFIWSYFWKHSLSSGLRHFYVSLGNSLRQLSRVFSSLPQHSNCLACCKFKDCATRCLGKSDSLHRLSQDGTLYSYKWVLLNFSFLIFICSINYSSRILHISGVIYEILYVLISIYSHHQIIIFTLLSSQLKPLQYFIISTYFYNSF
jgi:hypothetical protein